jgi:hypothetical protein
VTDKTEVWLIEQLDSSWEAPMFVSMDGCSPTHTPPIRFTQFYAKAMWFARKEDANDFARVMLPGIGVRICAHIRLNDALTMPHTIHRAASI